jgi:hypothetical protein
MNELYSMCKAWFYDPDAHSPPDLRKVCIAYTDAVLEIDRLESLLDEAYKNINE